MVSTRVHLALYSTSITDWPTIMDSLMQQLGGGGMGGAGRGGPAIDDRQA